MDSLFPEMPKDLQALSDDELQTLLDESVEAAALIDKDDEKFLSGLSAEEIITEYKAGAEQIKELRAEQSARVEAHDAFVAEKEKIKADLEVKAESSDDDEEDAEEEADAASEESSDDDDSEEEEPSAEAEEVQEETRELVTASADTPNGEATAEVVEKPRLRRPPAPAAERVVVTPEPEVKGASLVAAGEMGLQFKEDLTPLTLAELVIKSAMHHGPHPKVDPPKKYRFGGPEHKIAHADFPFPEDRQLKHGDTDGNLEKIRAIGSPFFGKEGQEALVASGGLCAPLEPIYSMPNFASDAEPVWDALPKFQAERGGVNVPDATTIGDISTAISSISEENDALGGTFATKSCQDLSCPSYTEVAVQILAHCREYGNLNARAWPEKIRHENELTMAALARTSETFILERIKALSVNVTNGAATLSALSYLVEAITRARWGIRGRLRMPNNVRFRALLPIVMIDMLLLDTVQTIDGNRFKTREQLAEYLSAIGIDVVWYMDGDFAAGDDMIPDASQTAAAIDPWPNTFQWAIYPEGEFLGIDMGVLELGIVRDSTLNSTNDFQVFGERFRNVARIGPAQGAYWVTSTICANGTFPPAGTQRTCES